MYSFNSRIRYSELNHKTGTLPCSSIINYFQDCSTFQSEDIHRGLSYLHAKNRVWLLSSWQLQIFTPARLGDYITIGTWAYDFKGFYGYRNFIMKDYEEKVLAAANSIWVYIDTEEGKPVRIPADHAGYELEPPYPMDYSERKIRVPVAFEAFPSFSVIRSNIDSYHHVNNGQYIKMAEEFLPENFEVHSLRVEYRMQAVLGDLINPLLSEEDGHIIVTLAGQNNKPYSILDFKGSYKN